MYSLDVNSLYPSSIEPGFVATKRAFATTVGRNIVGRNIVPVKPMSDPSGNLFYSTFNIVSPFITRYKNTYNVIHVLLNDTVDNIIELFEQRTDIILSCIVSCDLCNVMYATSPTEAIFKTYLGGLHHNSLFGGMSTESLTKAWKNLGIDDRGFTDVKDKKEKTNNIKVDAVLYVPNTPFVKKYNLHEEYGTIIKNVLNSITCEELIRRIYDNEVSVNLLEEVYR